MEGSTLPVYLLKTLMGQAWIAYIQDNIIIGFNF